MITQQEWDLMAPYEKYKTKNSLGETVRIAKEDADTGFVYKKGSSRYGWRYRSEVFMKNYTLVESADKNIEWQKRLDRALKALNKTGLWEYYRELFNTLKLMNYYDKQDILNLYWKLYDIKRRKLSTEDYNKEFNDLFRDYVTKYPFIFKMDDAGVKFVDTDYLFETSDCKLKSMYFGSDNKRFKEDIKTSLQNKTNYKLPYRVTTSYDISYQYSADKNKAWYSEEYIGTGNGHYYIALDENTALFVEND